MFLGGHWLTVAKSVPASNSLGDGTFVDGHWLSVEDDAARPRKIQERVKVPEGPVVQRTVEQESSAVTTILTGHETEEETRDKVLAKIRKDLFRGKPVSDFDAMQEGQALSIPFKQLIEQCYNLEYRSGFPMVQNEECDPEGCRLNRVMVYCSDEELATLQLDEKNQFIGVVVESKKGEPLKTPEDFMGKETTASLSSGTDSSLSSVGSVVEPGGVLEVEAEVGETSPKTKNPVLERLWSWIRGK